MCGTHAAIVDPASLITRTLNQAIREGSPVISLTCTVDSEPMPNKTWSEGFADGSDSSILFIGEQFILPRNRAIAGKYHYNASTGIGNDVNHTVNVFIHFRTIVT